METVYKDIVIAEMHKYYMSNAITLRSVREYRILLIIIIMHESVKMVFIKDF